MVVFKSKKKLVSWHIPTVHAQDWIPNTQEPWKYEIFMLYYRAPE
jgi:hypothetical protein